MRTVKDSQGVEYAHTTVLIPLETHQKARSLKINISETCATALKASVNALEGEVAGT